MRRGRRTFGFTLIEIMVAMALAGLIVAGALQLHASFGKQTERQNEVAEMQQNLRVSMLFLERAIRNAGFGIPGGMLPETSSNPPSCTNNIDRFHYGFEWSNSNTYTDPMTIVTWAGKPATNNDVDPDYFWVMAGDSVTTPLYAADDVAGLVTLNSATTTLEMGTFQVHDLFALVFPSSGATCTGAATCPLLSVPAETLLNTGDVINGHCLREITAFSSAGATKTISHTLSTPSFCFNYVPSGGTDNCAASVHSIASATGPVQLRRIPSTVTAYRVMPAGDTYNSGGTPKLTRRVAAMNTAYNTGGWQVLAENIDDMQIAVISQSGLVCNQANDPTYNPTLANSCDITSAIAVRITLSARSSSKMAGVTVDTTPLAEDRIAVTDPTVVGYLHRSLTAEIELRNMGSDASQ